MKKIITIAFVLVFACSLSAQTNYSASGTWRYTSGTDTIDIYLKPYQMTLNNITYSVLFGFHRYVKNGVVLENTLDNSSSSYSQDLWSILTFDDNVSKTKIGGNIKDLTLNNKRHISFEKVDPQTMNVKLSYIEGVRDNSPYGFTLPQQFQLIRQ